METKVTCRLVKIKFRNEESGFTILVGEDRRSCVEYSFKGVMASPVTGCDYTFTGEWGKDPKWGVEFKFTSYEQLMPTTKEGIMKYLCSEYVIGIGKKYAKIIVDYFGEKTIEILDNDIDRLSRIKGIGKKRLESIKKSWRENQNIRNIMVFLQGYGVSTTLAVKIYRSYGDESISKVSENPYCLADDFAGVGFKTADGIARKMGYALDDIRRCRAGVIYTLDYMTGEGHVCAYRDQLIEEASQLLSIDKVSAENAIDDMVESESVIKENDCIYLTSLYYDEKKSADKIKSLASILDVNGHVPNIESIEKSVGMQYDEIQRDAIYTACSNNIMVLTGGPGTGKTTTVKGIIYAFEKMNKKVYLAAPTGRAAKRMSEATGRDAQTIHRLLEYMPGSGWGKDYNNPLDCDVLIVDECSMIDISLMRHLLDAVTFYTKVVFVGDIDQLPSVGAGNCLRDIIDSGIVPVVRLERIFRQAMQSNIIMGAHAVNKGELPNLSNNRESDFFFLEESNPDKVMDTVLDLVEKRIPDSYGYKSGDVQVLSPMRRGNIGTECLNENLQRRLNTEIKGLKYGNTVFKKGDRVMQIKNNYDKGVFNGDVGTVSWVDDLSKVVHVYFGETGITYKNSEIEEIVLAYATTIHKSQGSEYPVVVVPVMSSHHIMLQRNLIYTAITRAKKLCIMIGEKKALGYAVKNFTVAKRNSNLR
ncbi:MAG: ATP-dependent RecD-like DNA helicase, partial [Prevotella sp.]